MWAERYCNSPAYGEWVRAQCTSTCNACQDECNDDYSSCHIWKGRGFCEGRFIQFTHTFCKKSCEVCNVQQLSIGSEPMEVPAFGLPAAPPNMDDVHFDDVQVDDVQVDDIEVVSDAVVRGPWLLCILVSGVHLAFFNSMGSF